ncbi:regulator of volume decrease after cellular swelling-domain-containing protein [Boletus reticuloceps]|uniref:Regulator of volume decrease after cellular swelling-domain-containing protein n=1 Tax=Boletus reticuloceps TaxID=495285 RepID=A0A8I3A7S4_9AGAM|nr:regulator of volume decrease after cellular swelling-domain-containing protein [Boletus reticuloceps]
MSSESTLIITAVPDFISPEEHRNIVASTPSSFSDIRPVLRYKQEHVSVILDPPLDAFTPEDSANGVLYIIESALVFMSSTGRGLQVKYPAITLHAIARGETPFIYCQLDESNTSTPPDDTSEEVTEMRELTIVPQDPELLESIFEAMSLCASLHPDPNVSEEDDEFEGDFVSDSHFERLDGEEGEELSQVGRAALAHLESIIHDPFDPEAEVNGSFDDAEEVLGE